MSQNQDSVYKPKSNKDSSQSDTKTLIKVTKDAILASFFRKADL